MWRWISDWGWIMSKKTSKDSLTIVLTRNHWSPLTMKYTHVAVKLSLPMSPQAPTLGMQRFCHRTGQGRLQWTRGSDNDPVTAAAYMHLLGESLSLIGHCLQETDKLVCVSKSLCVLLDSLLCTLAPLISLTSQIPELQGCFEHTVDSTLENVSYVMPGLWRTMTSFHYIKCL